jgi:hypothetical protein
VAIPDASGGPSPAGCLGASKVYPINRRSEHMSTMSKRRAQSIIQAARIHSDEVFAALLELVDGSDEMETEQDSADDRSRLPVIGATIIAIKNSCCAMTVCEYWKDGRGFKARNQVSQAGFMLTNENVTWELK